MVAGLSFIENSKIVHQCLNGEAYKNVTNELSW